MLIACYTSGAYHLELVPDLTTNAFLRAFGNFIATRGFPSSIRSDNAGTFRKAKDMLEGASKIYQESLINGDKALQTKYANKNIKWNCNPPLASHFGGKHERGIRTVRELIEKSIGTTRLPFCDMHACLKQMEMIMNSRPLIRARGVHEEGDFVITPAHLMIGRSLTAMPKMSFEFNNSTLYQDYKSSVKITDTFWGLYQPEHLQEIANRTKWYKIKENLKIDDLVLLKDDNARPLDWKTGLVSNVVKGNDGLVGVVELKTVTGTFTRPISKVVLIPGGPNSNSEINRIDLAEKSSDDVEIIQEKAVSEDKLQDKNVEDVCENDSQDETVEISEDNEKSELELKENDDNANANVISPELVVDEEIPTVRRSKRIRQPKAIFSLLLCLLVLPAISAKVSFLRVESDHGGGAMVYQKELVMLSQGVFHAYIRTNAVAEHDAKRILYQYHQLWIHCDQSRAGLECF